MKFTKKQLKINKLFHKKGTSPPEDCKDLEEEIHNLEQVLKEKQNELFQLQRNACRHKLLQVKKDGHDKFIEPQKIVLNNTVQSLKNSLELMTLLTGVEVQSYITGDHCSVIYHMQHPSEHVVKHGLRINMQNDDNEVSKSFPLGFNYKAVVDEFDNVKSRNCILAIRKALVAYYDRLEQFNKLKNLVNLQGKLFKTLDSSHIEITFFAYRDMEDEDERLKIVLTFDYRVYDVRPKTYTIKETDLPEGAVEAIREQCTGFKRQPLHKAFKDAFIKGDGAYKMIPLCTVKPPTAQHSQRKRFKPNKQNYNNDDTFQPEDCSESSDDLEA